LRRQRPRTVVPMNRFMPSLTALHDATIDEEARMPIGDGLIGDPPNPYGPVGTFGGIHVYVKPDMLPGQIELRDRYGVLIGTIRNVRSIAVHGEKKET
jgi:hypothetical protein